MDVSEQLLSQTLVENRGDLMLTAGKLGMRPSKLVDAIKSVPSVAATWQAMERIKADPEFHRITQEQFQQAIAERSALYRLDGLEVIHELAMTDHEGVSGLAEVRLKAAIALRGTQDTQQGSDQVILQELNSLYHQSARRIKSLRAVQIDYEELDTIDQSL